MVTLRNMTRDYTSEDCPCTAQEIVVLIKKFLSGFLSEAMTLTLVHQDIWEAWSACPVLE